MSLASDSLPLAVPEGSMAARMLRLVETLQDEICRALEAEDGVGRFRTDRWERPGGGGGRSRVLEAGTVLEKAGVNVSAVHGSLPARMATLLGVEAAPFFATGISLVLHPRSPFVPTVHANFRYFGLGDDLEHPDDEWFGGGADLTPHYPTLADAQHFHRTWKAVCDASPVADYDDFKRRCDDYFYLPHRRETRGVGGIFYDHLRGDPDAAFAFSRAAGLAFLESYLPIVRRHRDRPWGEAERRYQEIRRGRYVEFNLLFDRGTRFGIETDGRAESILMSLPPHVQWPYDWHPPPGSPEAHAARFFRPHDWLALRSEQDLEDTARVEPRTRP